MELVSFNNTTSHVKWIHVLEQVNFKKRGRGTDVRNQRYKYPNRVNALHVWQIWLYLCMLSFEFHMEVRDLYGLGKGLGCGKVWWNNILHNTSYEAMFIL